MNTPHPSPASPTCTQTPAPGPGIRPRHEVVVRKACRPDLPPAVTVLAAAFTRSSLAHWAFPSLSHRTKTARLFAGRLLDDALTRGSLHVATVAGTIAAVAAWQPITGHHHHGPAVLPGYATHLPAAVSGSGHRAGQLYQTLLRHHHLGEWHHYLAAIAVHPHHRHHGVAAALLRHHHRILDDTGLPAYAHATPDLVALLTRHGYRAAPAFRIDPSGPVLYPMRRPVTSQPHHTARTGRNTPAGTVIGGPR